MAHYLLFIVGLIWESGFQRDKRKALATVNARQQGKATTECSISAPKGHEVVLFKMGVESTPVHIFKHSLQ